MSNVLHEKAEGPTHLEVSPHTVDLPSTDHMTAWQICREHPFIVVCAVFAQLGNFMYGYDIVMTSLTLSMLPFQQQFGDPMPLPTGQTMYVIPSYWLSLWNALGQVAAAISAASAGFIIDRIGRRGGFALTGILACAGTAVLYICEDPPTFLAGKIVIGLAVGLASVSCNTYVAEISPTNIRTILLSLYAPICGVGTLVAACITFTRTDIMSADSYRVLFASCWGIAGFYLLGAYLVPESPAFYLRTNQLAKAEKSLQRLYGKTANVQPALEDLIRTDAQEKALNDKESSSYAECFRRRNWRRTRINLYANSIIQLQGSSFIANSAYFFTLAGMSISQIGMLSQLQGGFAVIAGLVAAVATFKIKARTILLVSSAFTTLVFLAMGIAGCFPDNSDALWAVGSFMVVASVLGQAFTMGPSLAIAAVVPEMGLKGKTQSVGFLWNFIFSTIWNVVIPYMYGADSGNLGGKTGFIFAATSAVALTLTFFEIPDTKDIPQQELNILFENKVKTRHFSRAAAQAFSSNVDGKII